jgi:hypothetical protein
MTVPCTTCMACFSRPLVSVRGMDVVCCHHGCRYGCHDGWLPGVPLVVRWARLPQKNPGPTASKSRPSRTRGNWGEPDGVTSHKHRGLLNIHSSIHSFIHSFTHSFIHPFIHSFIHVAGEAALLGLTAHASSAVVSTAHLSALKLQVTDLQQLMHPADLQVRHCWRD